MKPRKTTDARSPRLPPAQVEDLAALHPRDRLSRQDSPRTRPQQPGSWRTSRSGRAARTSAACDSASSARSETTSAASTSSPEPASSPGAPGRYYHPGPPTQRSRITEVFPW